MNNYIEFQNLFLQKHITIKKYINKKSLRFFIDSLEIKLSAYTYDAIEEILLDDKNKEFSSLLLNNLFNSNNYAQYFKSGEVYSDYLVKLMTLSIKEKDIFLCEIEREMVDLESEFEAKYKEQAKAIKNIVSADNIANLYPKARKNVRVITSHLGPTNSGKTYGAILALKAAKTGLYLAPLRLLAREVYDDLKKDGIKVSLITGEERIIDPEATHTCSTVEMCNIEKEYDTAVIDEIQFLGDLQRGNAWTRALLGLDAKRIIVMGSLDAGYLINKIAEKTGDIVNIQLFERLAPLEIKDSDIKIDDLKKGDAIITFSRKSVHKIVRLLEEKFDLKVSLIYGALPPEVRLEEARRFNAGETDILVSTDAIGYGLNLNIQRVIFSTVGKFNGEENEIISESSFKQIAGRAGRYGKIEDGEVVFMSTFNRSLKRPNTYNEYLNLNKTFEKNLPSLERAYYFPEWDAIERIGQQTEESNSLRKILITYLQSFKDSDKILKFDFMFLDQILLFLDEKDLNLENKYNLVFAPVRDSSQEYFEFCVEKIIDNTVCPSYFNVHLEKARNLIDLETISHEALLYMWLSQRYPDIFTEYDKAKDVYDEISYMIIDMLKEGY